MPVSTTGRRFLLGIAVIAAMLLFSSVHGRAAVAFHMVPPTPSYVTEFSVPGSANGAIANGIDDSVWVPGRSGAVNQIVRIDAGTPPAQTAYDIPLPAAGLAVAGGRVWASATDGTTAKILALKDPVPVAGGRHALHSCPRTRKSWAWRPPRAAAEHQHLVPSREPRPTGVRSDRQARHLGRRHALRDRRPDPHPPRLPGVALDGNLGLSRTAGVIEVAEPRPRRRWALAEGVRTEGMVRASPTTSPIYGPDSALWFIEILATGQHLDSKMSITGALAGTPERHTLSSTLPQSLTADTDGYLWFTTGGFGNVGRMAADGQTVLLCAGPGHPNQIAPGPGANVTFTQLEDKVVSIPVDAAGHPAGVRAARQRPCRRRWKRCNQTRPAHRQGQDARKDLAERQGHSAPHEEGHDRRVRDVQRGLRGDRPGEGLGARHGRCSAARRRGRSSPTGNARSSRSSSRRAR